MVLAGTIVSVLNPAIAADRLAIEKVVRLKQLDTELSLLLLRTRHSLAANYDPVVAAVRGLEEGSADLANGSAMARAPGAKTVATAGAAREAAREVILRKLQLVEDFKSSFAVLRNSIAVLSVLAIDLGEVRPASDDDAEIHRRATVLLLALSRLFMDGGVEQAGAVDRARVLLTARPFAPGPLREIADKIVAQSAIAGRYRAQTDGRVTQLLALPVAARLDAVSALYARNLALNDLRRWGVMLGLGLTALASAVLAIRGLRSQRRTRVSLEQRVEERTRALAEANATLTRASRAKTEFLANMSHEIRTPLAAILGFADLLEGERLKHPERREIARVIRRNGEHLLAILSDILDITKIEAGKLTVEEISCSPSQIAEEVCALLRNRAEAKGITLALRVESTDVPGQIESDPTRIRQILVNLIGNAIKFTEQGSVTVVLVLEKLANSRWLRFEVRDTGIGMSPEEMARVFADFEQVDTSTTRRFGGTGLGLAICRRLTAVLGGEVTVRSARNRGSTFVLRLPVHQSDALLSQDLLDTAIIAPRGIPPRRGLRVLVADDSADIQLLVTRFLADINAEVAVVSNGRQAVETALTAMHEGRPYDLILMDLHMPELDGAEAVRILRNAGMTVPVIALTASAYLEDRDRCARAGYSDFLTKPIDRMQLVQKIATLSGIMPSKGERLPTPITPTATVSNPTNTGLTFDRDRLLALVGGDHAVRDTILGLFQGDAPSLLQSIHSAISSSDTASVRAGAHKLKGMLLTVCAAQAAEVASELEASARAGQSQLFETLAGELQGEVTKVCEAMAEDAAAAAAKSGQAASTGIGI